jgi:hypothetical protein
VVTATVLMAALLPAQTLHIQLEIAQSAFDLGVQIRQQARGSGSAILGPNFPSQQFQFAARLYDGCRGAGGIESAALERSLGHAYFLAGDLPHAILAYRGGLRFDPGDAKLRTALDYARAQVQYPPSPDLARLLQPERDYWPGWLSLRRLGVYAFLLYFAACLAATRWRMTRRRGWRMIAVAALLLTAVPAVGSAVLWQRERRDAAAPVVVVARDCPLRIGNGPDYPPRLDAPLPRGAEARQLFERNGWYQVELASGVVGWLPGDAVVGDGPG